MNNSEKKFFIQVWIPVGHTLEEALSLEDAEAELKHLTLMQPENRYEIEEILEE